MTEAHEIITDTELAVIADASRERAHIGERAEPSLASASLEDVLRAARDARRAAEHSGVEPASDIEERRRVLIPVLERLPASMRTVKRQELEQRTTPHLLAAVRGWRWDSGNILMAGRTRIGKTTAAVYLVRRLVAEGAHHGGEAFELAKSIRWQESCELAAAVREFKWGTGAAEEIIGCKHARLLILDDLAPASSPEERDAFERVLQFRISRAWPTITTTNVHPDDLDAAFGERFTARLLERGRDKGLIVGSFE